MTLSVLSTAFILSISSPATPGSTTSTATAGSSDTRTESKAPHRRPFMRRYEPERNTVEIGIFGGIMLISPQHELYDPNRAWQRYKRIAPDIGARFAYYPLRFLGIEAEGAVMPTKTAADQNALLYGVRGHLIGQFPRRISPFVLLGVGGLGTSGSLGSDIDPALHFGGGVKFLINSRLTLRLDIRDNVAPAVQLDNGRTNYIEILLGLSLTLARKKATPKQLIDSDRDGIFDPGQGLPKREEDACPDVPGPASNRGCPLQDSDSDGLFDPGQGLAAENVDNCPNSPGPRSSQGCPLLDSDSDGSFDPGQGLPPEQEDLCPNEPGPIDRRGCPLRDSDGDGFFDPGQGASPEDKCPAKPETRNNYRDDDGCPDEVPSQVAKFTGAIRGINFAIDKDVIRPNSRKTLNAAVKVLKDFPDVRIEISGHTDSDGSREHNIDLSRRRAEAVKTYLVEHGIRESRIETRGAGPDEPIEKNTTKSGKAKNRRIEFKLLTGSMQSDR